jgi:hypothetical protein
LKIPGEVAQRQSKWLLTIRSWVRSPLSPQKRYIPSHTDNVDIRSGVVNVGSNPSVPTK